MRTKASLVEVSPSTLMRLNEFAATSPTRRSSALCATLASVAMNPSMVAMSGRIIPAPFAIPVTTAAPSARRDLALGTVSVVMIAWAARPQLSSPRSATHAGSPVRMRSRGSGSMITPVENGSTSRGSQPSSRAACSQLARASAIPALPVPALALPVLTTSARVALPEARCSLATCTGAAQKRFWVNTPATLVPSASAMSSRSLRPDLRIPASVTPSLTPSTGRRSSGLGGLRLTAIFLHRFRSRADSGSGELPVAVFVFFSRAARAGIVASDLADVPHERRGLGGGRCFAFGTRERFLVARVLVLDILDRRRLKLLRLLDLLAHLQLDRHQRARHFQLDRLDQIAEQLEGLALVLLLGIFLSVAAQVYALAQVVERGEVLAPVIVERREQYDALVVAHRFRWLALHLAAVGRIRLFDRALEQCFVVETRLRRQPFGQGQLQPKFGRVNRLQAGKVPLFLHALFGNVDAKQIGDHTLAQGLDLVRYVLRFEYGISQLIDLAPLVVGDVVVFEQLLADVEVVRLDLALRALDRAGHQAVFDRLAFGHAQALHDGVDPLSGEDPQQRIFEREKETRGARVPLPARAAAQLVVDAARFVSLGADDVQATRRDDLVVQILPLPSQSSDAGLFLGRLDILFLPQQVDLLLDVAAEHDVGAAASHIGRDGDHLGASRLRDDLGLARVLFRIQHLMRQLLLLQHAGDELGVLDRCRADEHRLAAIVAVPDVGDDRLVLLARGAEHLVVPVGADHRHVGRDDDHFQAVDLLEFVGLGIRGPRHPRQLAVHAEVVLEGDRGERLVLALDRHVLLGFDRLMQTVRPAPARHQPVGEFVDDDHVAFLHDVVPVAKEEIVGTERRVQMMHQVHVRGLVEAAAFGKQLRPREELLGVFVPLFRQQHRVVLLVDVEIARRVVLLLALQQGCDLVDTVVDLGAILGLTGDDERRA